MIGFPQKITKKIFRQNAFEQKKEKIWVKFNPGLSANLPSNNWAHEDNTMRQKSQ